jgi:hypothetical protein
MSEAVPLAVQVCRSHENCEMAETNLYAIDFDLLGALDEHGRNVARNLAQITEYDRDRINDRLSNLSRTPVLEHIGPAERSGLYEITEEGQRLLEYRDQYNGGVTVTRFLAYLDRD